MGKKMKYQEFMKKAAELGYAKAEVNGDDGLWAKYKETGKLPPKKGENGNGERPTYGKKHKDVEYEILKKSSKPMKAKEISDVMVAKGQISGKTPQATVARDLWKYSDMFQPVAKGLYVAVEQKDEGYEAVLENGKVRMPLEDAVEKFGASE